MFAHDPKDNHFGVVLCLHVSATPSKNAMEKSRTSLDWQVSLS